MPKSRSQPFLQNARPDEEAVAGALRRREETKQYAKTARTLRDMAELRDLGVTRPRRIAKDTPSSSTS
ncbi:MAG: hypothetical protein HY471_00740 [Candidatus Sungbacteria bacterium]|nr:hypothetical protein [Candidatus Sungbacteria bacterium]